MTEDCAFLLEVIKHELEKQGGDIAGRVELVDDSLSACDGRMLLRAEVRNDSDYHPSITHCHVFARMGKDTFCDPLDACVMGIDADRRQGLTKAGQNWVTNVGSALLSLLHAKPVMDANHFDGIDPWGVPGCHGFIGPLFGYGMKEPVDAMQIMNAGLFDCASAMAPPGIIHLAKVVLEAKGTEGWTRTLEIDGHLACFEEKGWDCGGIAAPPVGIASQFAVFHYADQKGTVESRRQLDHAIRKFVATVGASKDVDAATQALREERLVSDLIHQMAALLPLAFFRVIFAGLGMTFSKEYHRVKGDGTVEVRKLMREPVFARAVAMCPDMIAGGLGEAVKFLATCSSTFNAVNAALNAGSKPENLLMGPPVIPDPDADAAAIKQAIKLAQPPSAQPPVAQPFGGQTPSPGAPVRRPWWRFW
jgi:hypothetical protein